MTSFQYEFDRGDDNLRISITSVFDLRPDKWGLRGDPYLWDDIREEFRDVFLPYGQTQFINDIVSLFEEKTGQSIDNDKNIYIEKYAYGGMSSGGISPEFWKRQAIPLLAHRLREVNMMYENIE